MFRLILINFKEYFINYHIEWNMITAHFFFNK